MAQRSRRRRDPVLEALEGVVNALKENSRRNQEVARRAKWIQNMRAKGKSYAEIVGKEPRPVVVELLRDNLARLLDEGTTLRRVQAQALYKEGLTMEEIAEVFGVTRQRISALLRESNAASSKRASKVNRRRSR